MTRFFVIGAGSDLDPSVHEVQSDVVDVSPNSSDSLGSGGDALPTTLDGGFSFGSDRRSVACCWVSALLEQANT